MKLAFAALESGIYRYYIIILSAPRARTRSHTSWNADMYAHAQKRFRHKYIPVPGPGNRESLVHARAQSAQSIMS